MSDNIEKVLSRGEKLDLLVDKTDNLMFEVCEVAAACTPPSVQQTRMCCWPAPCYPQLLLPLLLMHAPVAQSVLCCRTSIYSHAHTPRHLCLLYLYQADRFVKSGRALRRKMWWNNLKMKVVMGVAVIMVVVIIFLLICFGSGHSCVRRGKSAASSPDTSSTSNNGSIEGSNSNGNQTQTQAPAAPSSGTGARRRLLLSAAQAAEVLASNW